MAVNPRASAPVPSPCVGVCMLNDDRVCQGCGRLIDEIARWGGSSDAERAAIVERAQARMLIIGDRLKGTRHR